MRSSFDPQKLIIDPNDIKVSQKVLETFFTTNSQLNFPRSEELEIPLNQLSEIKAELLKLRSTLQKSKMQYQADIQPLITALEQIQVTRNFNQRGNQNMSNSGYDSMQKPLQSQKQSQNRNMIKNEKLNNSNRGSERSMRSMREQTERSTGNPLDIWYRSEPMFAPLPTAEEINAVFRSTIEKSLQGASLTLSRVTESQIHWSQTLMEKVSRLMKDSKRNLKLQPPPGPPPSPDDISDYWVTNPPPFPIENQQKRNCSTMHYLLSSLVETKATKPATPRRKDQFLPLNVLAPKLEFDKYLSLDFDVRLTLELKSIGLDKNDGQSLNHKDTFTDEVAKHQAQIRELIPRVEESNHMILEKLPLFRKLEDQHYGEQQYYNELFQLSQSKKRKK